MKVELERASVTQVVGGDHHEGVEAHSHLSHPVNNEVATQQLARGVHTQSRTFDRQMGNLDADVLNL